LDFLNILFSSLLVYAIRHLNIIYNKFINVTQNTIAKK
jgi:hypothetical protein